MRDLKCTTCGATKEDTVSDDEKVLCACGGEMERLLGAGHVFTTIIPDYPGSKRLKAGYVHSHSPRPAEKVTSHGFGPGRK